MTASKRTGCAQWLTVPHTKQAKSGNAKVMVLVALLFVVIERVTEDTLALQLLFSKSKEYGILSKLPFEGPDETEQNLVGMVKQPHMINPKEKGKQL